jgi:hypothetical protein
MHPVMAMALGVQGNRLRLRTPPHSGGSFGAKHAVFPYVVLLAFAGPAFFYVDDDDTVYIPEHNGGMISILTLDGERLARWGDGPINRSCHGIWVDSHHDLYVVQPGEWGRVRRVVKYERQ